MLNRLLDIEKIDDESLSYIKNKLANHQYRFKVKKVMPHCYVLMLETERFGPFNLVEGSKLKYGMFVQMILKKPIDGLDKEKTKGVRGAFLILLRKLLVFNLLFDLFEDKKFLVFLVDEIFYSKGLPFLIEKELKDKNRNLNLEVFKSGKIVSILNNRSVHDIVDLFIKEEIR